jgi:hypothetical protein
LAGAGDTAVARVHPQQISVSGGSSRRTEGTRKMKMRTIAMGAAAAAVLAVSGGVTAYASIPDSGGVIHGCYNKGDGSLSVIDTSVVSTCPKGETGLNWSQTGPKGPPGPPGPPGQPGPAGSTHAWTDTSASVTASIGPSVFPNTVVSVNNLPPGNYVAWVAGETDVTDDNIDVATCDLTSNSGTMQHQTMELYNPPVVGTYALTGATTLPSGGTISLDCTVPVVSFNAGFGPIEYRNNSLTVMQVGSIN